MRRFLLARRAPRGPEVEHDDLPPQRGEPHVAFAVQPRQDEARGDGSLAVGDRARDAAVSLVRQAPAEDCEQTRDDGHRSCLRAQLQPPGRHAATMKTGVPMSTWSNSHSASGMYIRMHPCERE